MLCSKVMAPLGSLGCHQLHLIGAYTCAPNGEFRHHLNIQPSFVTLSYQRGICFDGSGHLFVTCGSLSMYRHFFTQRVSGVECVYVFKPTGERVATLGQASSAVTMGCPVGIAIDEDGFVYVCDFGSSKNRIVVF